jgi:hypothetical protein
MTIKGPGNNQFLGNQDIKVFQTHPQPSKKADPEKDLLLLAINITYDYLRNIVTFIIKLSEAILCFKTIILPMIQL